MTTYTFRPNDTQLFGQPVSWNNGFNWIGGVAPDSVDADVVIPTIHYANGGGIYSSNIAIRTPESISVRSVDLHDNVVQLGGSLNVSGTFEQHAPVTLNGGTLTAGTLNNYGSGFSSQGISGQGRIDVSALTNVGQIAGQGDLNLTADTLTNTGTLNAGFGTFSVTVAPGGFTNLVGGTLTGGSYYAYERSTLAIDAGSVITTNAADITLNGGTITSHDPITGSDVSLTSSLQTIAQGGSLTLAQGSGSGFSYTFGALTVDGKLTIDPSVDFNSGPLTIGSTGSVMTSGYINVPITNDGVLSTNDYNYNYNGLVGLGGPVSGSGTLQVAASTTLQLAAPTAQNVSFTGNGNSTLQLDKPSTFTGSITPSGFGDRLSLTGVSLSSIQGVTYTGDGTAGTVTLQESGGSLSFNFVGNYTSSNFVVTGGIPVLSGDPPRVIVTVTNPLCFLAGTRILTTRGEIAVEALVVGDTIVTWTGRVRAIAWIGAGAAIVSPHVSHSRPVIVHAGALADGVPRRDLRVTEGHSLYLDGILVPASRLINGRTIRWDDAARTVRYYHIELDDHEILVADGAPAESYRDDGNRPMFSRASSIVTDRVAPPFAAVHCEGPQVDAIWNRLVARAGGAAAGLVADPDLHMIVRGRRVDPVATDGHHYSFLVDRAPASIMIASRHVVPADAAIARDARRLGVALRRILLNTGTHVTEIGFASDLLKIGFHEPEHSSGFRWTSGAALLPLPADTFGASLEIVLDVGCLTRYPSPTEARSSSSSSRQSAG
jgi:hypothetical protein